MVDDLVGLAANSPAVLREIQEYCELRDFSAQFANDEDYNLLFPPVTRNSEGTEEAIAGIRQVAPVWRARGCENVVNTMARLYGERTKVRTSGQDLMWSMWAEIAKAVDDPGSWIEEILPTGLAPHSIQPFLDRHWEVDRAGWQRLVCELASDTSHCLVASENILRHYPVPPELLEASAACLAEKPEIAEHLAIDGNIPGEYLSWLFASDHHSLASAAAVGHWTFVRDTKNKACLVEGWEGNS